MDYPHRPVIISYNSDGDYDGTGTMGPDDPHFNKRILCEGDSWFSSGGVPSSNLLVDLCFKKPTLLVNLAKPGDTIKSMSEISNNEDLEKLIGMDGFLTKWDAIFISGGGNDLIDLAANSIICNCSKNAGNSYFDYIDMVELRKMKTLIHTSYMKIAKLRDGVKNSSTPIFCHVYDYPTPRNSPAKFLGIDTPAGPWLYRALRGRDVPEIHWISISDYIYEYLVSSLIEMSNLISNFHVISETRNTLERADLGAKDSSGDWLNEIHPTKEGYEKIARVVSNHINKVIF